MLRSVESGKRSKGKGLFPTSLLAFVVVFVLCVVVDVVLEILVFGDGGNYVLVFAICGTKQMN